MKWVDINKGDDERPNYRSRLVVREMKVRKLREDDRKTVVRALPDHLLLGSMPPLEALKVIMSMPASGNKVEKMIVNDVSRAYFCAPAKRQAFV